MLKGVTIHKIEYTKEENDGFKEGLGNAHTHGMEKYGLKNLCLGVDFDKERTSYILNEVSELMSDPTEDMDMKKIHFLHNSYGTVTLKFRMIEAKCFDESVILIIVADPNGRFPGDKMCLEPYKYQLSNHHDIEW